jgi:hypothetical protein
LVEIMPLLKICIHGQRREVPDKHRAEVTLQLSSWIEFSKWPSKSRRHNDVHKAQGDISNMPTFGSGFSVDCARGLLVVIADHRTYPRSRPCASALDANANSTATANSTASGPNANPSPGPDSGSNSNPHSHSCTPKRCLDNIALFNADQSSTRHPSEYWECAVRDGFGQLSA